MLRNIVLGIAGLFLTLVLISFLGWLQLHYSEQGLLMQDLLAGRISQAEYAEAFFDGAERMIFIADFIQFPLIISITSGFVGFFARRKAWLPALFAITPVFMFIFKPDIKGISLGLLYALIAVTVASLISRWRFRPAFDQSPSYQ